MRVLYVLPVAWTALCGVASADPCQVTIARAPAEVRAAIESALVAEPHCRVPLELRVVATEGGYYLLARDFEGRTRERIVPDVASAATLVASWAADDELDDASARPVASSPAVAIALAPPSSVDVAPPSTVPAPHVPGAHVGLYAMAGAGGGGFRVELDVLRLGRWAIGIAGSRRTGDSFAMANDAYIADPVTSTEYDVVGYAAYERELGDAWHVRGAFGVGAAIVDATLIDPPGPMQVEPSPLGTGGTTSVPLVDGSLSIAADVGLGFSLVAGALVTDALDSPSVPISAPAYFGTLTAEPPPETGLAFSVFGGVRYEL